MNDINVERKQKIIINKRQQILGDPKGPNKKRGELEEDSEANNDKNIKNGNKK